MPACPEKSWFVYMVRCADNSLYTGIAVDVYKRVVEHNSSRNGARYTKARRPVRLVYTEVASSRSDASKREAMLKRLRKGDKERLIGPE